MKISEDLIKEALQFYNINDDDYINNCYECIEFIDKNLELKINFEKIYDILYNDKNDKISELWKIKKMEDMFGNIYHPFVTNILLICGYKTHIYNMKKYKLDKHQRDIHKIRVRETLVNDIYKRNYDGIRISQMLWGTYFINLRLIEVGRLQFEITNSNHINNKNEKCIKIHIPTGKKLDYDEVKKSIIDSKSKINKYFGLNDFNYYCESWLLSKQIKKLLDKNSNIIKFQSMFDIVEGKNCVDDVLNFVYNLKECDSYKDLQEDTILQKNIKKFLLQNGNINLGIGILKG